LAAIVLDYLGCFGFVRLGCFRLDYLGYISSGLSLLHFFLIISTAFGLDYLGCINSSFLGCIRFGLSLLHFFFVYFDLFGLLYLGFGRLDHFILEICECVLFILLLFDSRLFDNFLWGEGLDGQLIRHSLS
jgi:hypothetical protein